MQMTSQDSKKSKWIKCKFCDWKCPRFITTSRGKRVHNYYLLQEHCMLCHDEEMKKYGLLLYEDVNEFVQNLNDLIIKEVNKDGVL